MAVVGAGIAGLVGAHELARRGVPVEVYEASDRVGGLGTFFEHEDLTLDRFYHVLLPTDEALLDLIGDLGFREDVYWRETSLGFLHEGDLYRLDTPLDLLRFRPVPFLDRLRLGWSALAAAHFSDPEGLGFGTGYDKAAAFPAQLDDFVDRVRDTAPAGTDADARDDRGVRSVELIEAVYAAERTGERQRLEDAREVVAS